MHIKIRNLDKGLASDPWLSFFFVFSPRGGHGRMDFHPYGYETSICTLSAPH